MNFGVSYKQFLKNPIVAILFMAVMGLGYLYLDNKGVYQNTIERHELEIQIQKQEIKALQDDYKKLNSILIETIKEINSM